MFPQLDERILKDGEDVRLKNVPIENSEQVGPRHVTYLRGSLDCLCGTVCQTLLLPHLHELLRLILADRKRR